MKTGGRAQGVAFVTPQTKVAGDSDKQLRSFLSVFPATDAGLHFPKHQSTFLSLWLGKKVGESRLLFERLLHRHAMGTAHV